MYTMKADGVVFYDPSSDDMSLHVLSPKATFALNGEGELEFIIQPGNVMYDGLHKLTTIVTLEQDGEIVFRGRVLETVTNTYNQKEVYCEGELGFLYDSVVRPYSFKGKASDLFRQLVTKHNEQVEEYKQFEVGIITAVDDSNTVEPEGKSYTDTMSEIKSLLIEEFDGYLRIRHEGGKRYIDYVDALNQTCSQEIKFGVNIVDIENTVKAQDVCSVLVPLGKDGVTIKEVNDRKDYIEDPELIAQYGRIVKIHTFDDVSDPLILMRLANAYMDEMNAATTLTFKAVDLHECGVDVDSIRIGDTVKLNSPPHGIDKEDICTEIELDIEKPEKSEYTFGVPRETLSAGAANAIKSMSTGLAHTHKWLTETETALNIYVETTNLIGHRTTQLEIDVDAAEEAITLKASQQSVDILEEKNTAVELRLDAAEDAIIAKADLILLDGYVKTTELEAEILNVVDSAYISEMLETATLSAGRVVASSIDADGVAANDVVTGSLTLGGSTLTKKEKYFVTSLEISSYDGYVTGVRPITDKITYYE